MVGAVIISSVVWMLAHYSAAPSTQVSVLWGLVEYTKNADKSDESIYEEYHSSQNLNANEYSESDVDGSKNINLSSIVSINSWFSLSKKQAEDLAVRTRSERHLRPLHPLETGLPMSSLPDGVYAFFQISRIPEVGEYDERFWGGLSAIPEANLFIEVQSLKSSNILFVAYVEESEAVRVARLFGNQEISITVSPIFWGNFDSRIEVPVNRIVRGDTRRLSYSDGETHLIWDLTLK
jgi:hypothetical protein